MENSNRRDFLKKSILGTGAALFPLALSARSTDSKLFNAREEMQTRILGKTGLKIPLLSMGTGDTKNAGLIKAAIDSGIVLVGTSTYYGNGNNETLLGGVIGKLPRESFLVATSTMPKGTDHQGGLFTDTDAAVSFQRDIESSMKRLGVDYLDILFLPFAAKRESVFFEPLLRMMENFKKSGKARFLGIATHSYMEEAVRAAADTGIYDVAMTAYNFRSANPGELNEAIDYGARSGLGIIAMKTMAGGYWDEQRTQPISSAAALKWVLQNENIHTVMSGMTTFEELQRNLALMKDLKLNETDLKELKLAVAGLYCRQCRNCDGQCPASLDIPTLMRSYMYAFGYRNLDHAIDTLNQSRLPSASCDGCEICTVKCAAGFNVKDRIQSIARLKQVPREFFCS